MSAPDPAGHGGQIDWRRIEEIFLAAVDLPRERRDEFLRQACGDDEVLCQEAESLLLRAEPRDARIESILESLAASLIEDSDSLASPESPEAPPVERKARGIAGEGRFVPGTLLAGRYRIIALLGSGGMGEVYRATDLTLAEPVALKFLPEEASRNQRLLERFHSEVRLARQVSHPNVCRVYDIGEAEGMPFLSMEYVDGEDLAGLLSRIGRMPADKALVTARKICLGLGAAHDRGIMHRDLKPANIMINKRGDVVITDFGLAAMDSQFHGPEGRNGTPAYMAPEQLTGAPVTPRSDIYALGLVLFELFTGRRPFEGTTAARLLPQQEAAEFPSMSSLASDIDPAVDRAIRACLHPEPAKRPGTAMAVAGMLPGGDPLSVALAAGETPSPEAVAGGETQGLAPRYSLPCLGLLIVSLLALPVIRQRSDIFVRAPSYSPEVLSQKAREIAASLGYRNKPADSYVALSYRRDLLAYLRSQSPTGTIPPEWLASEAPLQAEYRESPSLLIAQPEGRVTRDEPPPVEPGMVRMTLDGVGHLLEFSAVPETTGDHSRDVPADAVFRAAGLDMGNFKEAVPAGLPAGPALQLRAWKGPHPVLPHVEVAVEIGWAEGQLTWARVALPPDRAAHGSSLSSAVVGQVLSTLFVIGLAFAAFLARRNWTRGRADRKGALRIAAVCVVLGYSRHLGRMHFAPDYSMVSLLYDSLGDYLLLGATLWVVYLALEPTLRSRWPHSIVTWNRLLAGRWRDAQVWAHVLIGATVGAVMGMSIDLLHLRFADRSVATDYWLYTAFGPREWLSGQAGLMELGLTGGAWLFFTIFVLRQVVRKDWLAALIASIIWMLANTRHMFDPQWWLVIPVFVVLFAVLVFVLLRLGLVAAMAAIFFANDTASVLLGSDWSAWYVPNGLATLAVLLGIGVFAFVRSLGDRELLGSVS